MVAYHFPSIRAGTPTPSRLVLSLDGDKDGKPPATGSWTIEPTSGEIHFPLRLEERDYTVRASAASEDGITSATASAPLPSTSATS